MKDTMNKKDHFKWHISTILDEIYLKYNVPFDAIAAVNPFMIIDEPHKFAKTNVTWENIQKMKPQFILRYGATFQEYENLIYKLTAVDAFNKNLVKGVIGHITEFKNGENAVVKLINTDGQEAKFELTENNKSITKSLAKRGSLEIIHQAMSDLFIESMNRHLFEGRVKFTKKVID